LPESDLGLLIDAARRAGEIATRYHRTDMEIRDKGAGQGPVSQADLEIDTMLRTTLLAARPEYGWLSEETEDDAARLSAEVVFIVDPIDGTRTYIEGGTTFAHSLAIARMGRVTEAVVFLPLHDALYSAREGQGAACNETPIRGSARSEIRDASVLAAKPQLAADNWPGGVPPVARHYRPSLAYRMCAIADGQFDAMLTLRDAWEWDIAAGDLICREAGVRVTDRTGADLAFNSARGMQSGVIAASPGIHGDFLTRLR